jgi:hypothetical protein
MSRHRNKPAVRPLLISIALSAAVLLVGWHFIENASSRLLVERLLWPLVQLMLTIGVGLLVGQVIEATGWTRRLAILARPLFRFSRLGDRCGAAFTAAFASGVAANAMLWDFYQGAKITRAQLYLANFVNQFPVFFLHLPTTFFTVIAMTGTAGLLYFVLTFAAAVLRTILLFVYARLRLPPEPAGAQPSSEQPAAPAAARLKGAWNSIRERLPGRLLRIGIYVVPIYVAVFVLNHLGLFRLTQGWLADVVVDAFIPMEALSVVVLSFVAEFTSGFAAAGAFMTAGILNVNQTVLALLTGNVLAFPIRALRHQLPHYMGIYSPRMGAELLILGQLLRVISIMVVGVLFYVVT